MSPALRQVRYFSARRASLTARAAFLRRTAVLCAAACAGCAFVQVLFAVFPWVAFPALWDVLIAALIGGVLVSAVELLWLRKPDALSAARAAETNAGLPHPWLSLSLELAKPSGAFSPDLAALVHERAAEALPLCRQRPNCRGLRVPILFLALSVAAVACATAFLQPRCVSFWKLPFSYLAPVSAVVRPGTVSLPVGAPCSLRLEPSSAFFPSCRIACASIDGVQLANTLLAPDDSGHFAFSLGGVSQSVVYRFTLGSKPFPPDTIFAVAAPRLSILRVGLVPPRYTGMRPSELPEGQGNFAAYAGTRARIFLSAQSPLSRALFVSPGKDTLPLSVSGRNAEGNFVVSQRRSYTFALVDTFGQTSDSIPLFSIEVIPDAPPSVVVERPGRSRDCAPSMAETLAVAAVDDIGIGRFSLFAKKSGEESAILAAQAYGARDSLVKLARIELPVALNRFSLYPGDTLWYWASACDNRRFGGPQCASSDTFFFRVPSYREIHEQVASEEDYAEQALKASRRRTGDMQRSVENLMQSAQGKTSISWEQRQIVRDLTRELAAQADSLAKAVESFKKSIDEIRQEQSASADLLAKMDEVQKAIEDLRRQFGDSLLFSLPKGNENVSMRELRESLEKLKNQLPDLAARLDNTLKFLEMLRRDQELGRLAADAGRLAREQKDVSSLQKNEGECMARQEGVCKGVDGLLSDLDKNVRGRDSALYSQIKLPAIDKLNPLQKSMRACMGENRIPSKADMNAMASSLAELSENLMAMQSCAIARRFEKERETLLDITHDALSLAGIQRSIAGEPQSSDNDQAGQTAEFEQDLANALAHSMGKMDRLVMVSPRALVSIKKAYDDAAASLRDAAAMQSGAGRRMVSREPEANLGAIAQAALNALADLGGQSQAQSGGMNAMMSGMRRLSARQAMLNAATGDLLRSLLSSEGSGGTEGEDGREGGGKSGARAHKAREEARAAQKEIADELGRLADSYGKDAGASLNKKTREMEEEARRLSNMLEHPSQELRDRQDRFLSRMLETSLSQHRQDEGKEQRKSESAKAVFSPLRPGTAGAARETGVDAYYRLRQRAFSGNFPESYRMSIMNYFDSLGVLFLKER
jgi:hypothetical protein